MTCGASRSGLDRHVMRFWKIMKAQSSNALLMSGAFARVVCLFVASVALVACHGIGSSGSDSSSSSFTIGGTITGLTKSSLVLANGSSTVSVSAGASTWTFSDSFSSDSSYSVTVQTQPAGELCEVTGGGSGTLAADVTDVTVECSVYGQWAWEGGLSTVDASGIYGTKGAASANNAPGARYEAISWTGPAGILWLFGGYGYDSTGALGALNDLWQYSPATAQWTWISGGDVGNARGIYGAQGVASASNVPGARYSSSSWIDASGKLWLFGGYGYDSTGALGTLNDLWQYSPSSGQWTWVSGGNVDNATGIYGAQGTPSPSNLPGARQAASAWVDTGGNLWLFAGYGYGSAGDLGSLSDLWRFSPSSGQWIWLSGGNANNAAGIYGTRGTASANAMPGARQAASTWVDGSGNLWLFGGYGYDSSSDLGNLNDLWKYSLSTGQWTWFSGSVARNASGVYGTEGTASASNVPGAREGANAGIDSLGSFSLFGGFGYDSSGGLGALNDLWQYSPATGQWTSIKGNNGNNALGIYGSQGTASGSSPGGRQGASSWSDSTGHLWLFGGVGYGSSANGYLNDLWQFIPP